MRNATVVMLAAVVWVGCAPPPQAEPVATASAPESAPSPVGAVFTATNLEDGNGIVMFQRAADGTLTHFNTVATLGKGSDDERDYDPLGSQGSIAVSGDRLFVVNAGSNEISVFDLTPGGIILVEKVSSNGEFPVSLTVHEKLLYVLNVGGKGNITAFTISDEGGLTPLEGSTRSLGLSPQKGPINADMTPTQVSFTAAGDMLVLTWKGREEPAEIGKIHVFKVGSDGLPSATPTTTDSEGEGPFGFVLTESGHLAVVEAGGGPLDAEGHHTGAVSTYRIEEDGAVTAITSSLGTDGKSSCWITGAGQYVYATNADTLTVTGYRVGADGALTRLPGLTPSGTHSYPLDAAMSGDGRFLYTLNPGTSSLGMFEVDMADGSLTPLGWAPIRPASGKNLQGVATWDY